MECRPRLASFLTSLVSFLRNMPLFIAARPKSPLRVLCVMAIDAIHMLRHTKPLSRSRIGTLAALLDFGACVNAALDRKKCCRKELCTTLRLLKSAGFRTFIADYVKRLKDLEKQRPTLDGDPAQLKKVQAYREAVVRLSLGTAVTVAMGYPRIEDGIRSTYCDAGLELLYRIVMQCQIIDDVWDYSHDAVAGLPSFLTASNSLDQAFDATWRATLGYATDRDVPRTSDLFCIRLALVLASACAQLVVLLGGWRQRIVRSRMKLGEAVSIIHPARIKTAASRI